MKKSLKQDLQFKKEMQLWQVLMPFIFKEFM